MKISLNLAFSFLFFIISFSSTSQIPPDTSANGTWMTFRGGNRHLGIQSMRGDFTNLPEKIWEFEVSPLGGCDMEPLVYDLDGDGSNEVVLTYTDSASGLTRDAYIYVLDGATGELEWSNYYPGRGMNGIPVIGDINADGNIDLVIGLGDNRIIALEGASGEEIWTRYISNRDALILVDIDDDPELEILTSSGLGNHHINVLVAETGVVKNTYPISGTGSAIASTSISVGDLDGDGDMDMAFSYGDGGSNFLKVIDGASGDPIWNIPTPYISSCAPAIEDIDKDGDMDLVVVDYYSKIYAYEGSNGALLWDYPATYASASRSSPSICDIDLDGTLEVIIGSKNDTLHVLNASNGNLKWKKGLDGPGSWFSGSPKIGNFDMSSPGLEIVVSTSYDKATNGVYLFSADGIELWKYQYLGHAPEGVTVADIDNDGCVEMIVTPDAFPWSTGSIASFYALDDIGQNQLCGQLFDEISEIEAQPFTLLYPNPSYNKVTLQFDNLENEIFTLELIDNLGRLIKTVPNIDGNEYTLITTRIKSGQYIIQLNVKGEIRYAEKLIIQ